MHVSCDLDSTDSILNVHLNSDELASKVLQSKNFDIMRTVGFITILAAVNSSTLGCFKCNGKFEGWLNIGSVCEHPSSQVRNTKPGGLIMIAPPCSTWVFLPLSVTNFIDKFCFGEWSLHYMFEVYIILDSEELISYWEILELSTR